MNHSHQTKRDQKGEVVVPRRHGVSFGHPPFVPTGPFVKPGRFGRMFPQLRPLFVTDEAIAALAAAMKEDPAKAIESDLPAGFTYFGQFVDHDITFDTTPMPERVVDPTQVHNFRTPALDLDSVYGDGPSAQPYLYERNDSRRLLVGIARESDDVGGGKVQALPNDLPRNKQGFALIGDPRNDENLLVAQTHVAFLKFHNKVVDTRKGISFDDARRAVTWHYQWIVLHDFLTRICGKDAVHSALERRRFYKFEEEPFIPIEFAVAAYRFGHSMVRESYDHNRVFGPKTPEFPRLFQAPLSLLFNFTGFSGTIDGGAVDRETLPSNWVIDWRGFHADLGKLPTGRSFNRARAIDPLLIAALHDLPGDGGSLAQRNLKRGVVMQLPSGQSVAHAMHIDGLRPEDFDDGSAGTVAKQQGLDRQTPLWFYILQEAKVKSGGQRLGPVGARIVAEVFVGILEGDRTSFLAQNPRWKPDLGSKGEFTMADMLKFVDDLNPVGD